MKSGRVPQNGTMLSHFNVLFEHFCLNKTKSHEVPLQEVAWYKFADLNKSAIESEVQFPPLSIRYVSCLNVKHVKRHCPLGDFIFILNVQVSNGV